MKKITITLFFTITLLNISFAQKLTFNPSTKINKYDSYSKHNYCGEINGTPYYLFTRIAVGLEEHAIVKFPANEVPSEITIINTKKLESRKGSEYYEYSGSFTFNNSINIIYQLENGLRMKGHRIFIDSYDLNGKKTNSTEIFNESEGKVRSYDLSGNFILSNNKKYIGFRDQNKYMVLDTKTFKVLKTVTLELRSIDTKDGTSNDCYALCDNGDLIHIQKTTTHNHAKYHLLTKDNSYKNYWAAYEKTPIPITIMKYSFINEDRKKVTIPLPNNQLGYSFKFKLSGDNKQLYLAISYGEEPVPSVMYGYPAELLHTKGIQLTKINLDKLEISQSTPVSINQNIIDQFDKKKKGVDVLQVTDIQEENGVFYVLTQRAFSQPLRGWDMNLIIFKFPTKGEAIQKIINTAQQYESSPYEYLGKYSSIIKNGNLYLIFNEGANNKRTINVLKLDANLETKNKISETTYKEHDIYMVNDELYPISNNKFSILGRWAEDYGSAILEVE